MVWLATRANFKLKVKKSTTKNTKQFIKNCRQNPLENEKNKWKSPKKMFFKIQETRFFFKCYFLSFSILGIRNLNRSSRLGNRSSRLSMHKQINACWSIPRSQSQTVFYHFKISRKWELWNLCFCWLLAAMINPASDPN